MLIYFGVVNHRRLEHT